MWNPVLKSECKKCKTGSVWEGHQQEARGVKGKVKVRFMLLKCFIHMCEHRAMHSAEIVLKWGRGMRKSKKKGEFDWGNCMHIWKYHNENQLYN
jgi:hypothetical protein